MGVNIHLKPTQVWPFFEENKARLAQEMVAIAENEDTEYSVYLTEENDCPLLSVYKEDKKLYEEPAVSEKDCETTAKQIYLKYLFPVVINTPQYSFDDDNSPEEDEDRLEFYSDEDELQNCEDAIYEREDELVFAMQDFLEVLLNCKNQEQIAELYGEDIVENLLDEFCQFLADEYLISVYRPTWVDDEHGTENFVEYPYLDVDDEDNGGASVVSRR